MYEINRRLYLHQIPTPGVLVQSQTGDVNLWLDCKSCDVELKYFAVGYTNFVVIPYW